MKPFQPDLEEAGADAVRSNRLDAQLLELRIDHPRPLGELQVLVGDAIELDPRLRHRERAAAPDPKGIPRLGTSEIVTDKGPL